MAKFQLRLRATILLLISVARISIGVENATFTTPNPTTTTTPIPSTTTDPVLALFAEIAAKNKNTTNTTVLGVKQLHHKITNRTSPLVKITRPLMNISRYYCSKGLSLHDWAHAIFFIDELMAADENTHNSYGVQKLSNALKKCAKFYRGDNDWGGPEIPIEDDYDDSDEETTTTEEPSVVYEFLTDGVNKAKEYATVSFDYVKDLSTQALKAVKIMTRKKRDVAVNQEALQIIHLLYEISKRACQPFDLYPIVDKYFLKIMELMEIAVQFENIHEDHVQPFISVRETLEECISSAGQDLWQMSEEFGG
ncbi:hypothetical protein Ocin01_18378 [Orchesella cincta]|uniref:Uncharacterized protein n=1 Tax=Orchesella cincta TaxID=48709 RepID=A0A1D2M5W4_ORCCI|nr:hypothetical protein Ocin01_18378 [Orchesella cincta]